MIFSFVWNAASAQKSRYQSLAQGLWPSLGLWHAIQAIPQLFLLFFFFRWSEICVSFNVIKVGKTAPLDFKIWISYSCPLNLWLKYSQHSFNYVLQILLSQEKQLFSKMTEKEKEKNKLICCTIPKNLDCVCVFGCVHV